MRFRYSHLNRAMAMASELHAAHSRKGRDDIPYLCHLLAVTGTVLEHGGSETQAVAAMLHDAAEDCGGRPVLDRIVGEFGPEVARLVAACTDTLESPKPAWRERKEAYLARLPSEPAEALLVKAADALHNLRASIADFAVEGRASLSKFNGDAMGLGWYYGAIGDILLPVLPERLKKELGWALLDYLRLIRPLPSDLRGRHWPPSKPDGTANTPKRFGVEAYDSYDCPPPNWRPRGEFDSADAALLCAQRVVDICLDEYTGDSPDEAFNQFLGFGDRTSIFSDEGLRFDDVAYAEHAIRRRMGVPHWHADRYDGWPKAPPGVRSTDV